MFNFNLASMITFNNISLFIFAAQKYSLVSDLQELKLHEPHKCSVKFNWKKVIRNHQKNESMKWLKQNVNLI